MLYAATQTVSANGAGSGNGGTITVLSTPIFMLMTTTSNFKQMLWAPVMVAPLTHSARHLEEGSDSSFLTVTAGTNGNGGTVELTADPDEGTIAIINDLDASGGSSAGDAGSITMSASDIDDESDSVTISANAPGSGNGGEITITSGDDFYVDDDDFQLKRMQQELEMEAQSALRRQM